MPDPKDCVRCSGHGYIVEYGEELKLCVDGSFVSVPYREHHQCSSCGGSGKQRGQVSVPTGFVKGT